MQIELTVRDWKRVHKMLKAIADPTRFKIVRYLTCCPTFNYVDEDGGLSSEAGASIGQVCCQIERGKGSAKVTPLMSYHIKVLKEAGVIEVERRGRFMVCKVNPEAAEALGQFVDSLGACCSEAKK